MAPVLDAVKKAVAAYGAPGIVNSEQGSHLASSEYTTPRELRKSIQTYVKECDAERPIRVLETIFKNGNKHVPG